MTRNTIELLKENENSLNKINILGNLFVGFLHENSAYLMELLHEVSIVKSKGAAKIQDITLRLNESLTQTKELINHTPTATFSIQSEIESVLKTMQFQFKSNNIKVTKEIKENYYRGYPVIFRQIIICILLNSVQSLERKNSVNKKIIVKSEIADRNICITIQDNGNSKKNLKIKNKSNTGLGLFFVKDAVSRYFKGELIISQLKQEGILVKVIIPINL